MQTREPKIEVERRYVGSGCTATMSVTDPSPAGTPRDARLLLVRACALYLQRHAEASIRDEEEQ